MRVLVTRPEPGGQITAGRLAAAGHEPVLMPLFAARITGKADDLPPADRIGGLIATSARAFSIFEGEEAAAKGVRLIPVHAVGPMTAQAARAAGFADIREGGGTASDLARSLVEAHEAAAAVGGAAGKGSSRPALVYLAGTPRKPVIEDALAAAGLEVRVVECYEMVEISYSTDILISDILSPPPDAVLIYSANAARRLARLMDGKGLGNALDSARFVCLSPAIAAALPERWRAGAVASDHPDEDRLLASLAALG